MKLEEVTEIKVTNSKKSLKFHRQGRVTAVALVLGSVLGVISTPALADSEVDVPYEVTVFESELPPCDGMETGPSWAPSDVVYDSPDHTSGSVDLAYTNNVIMTVDFNVEYGMDGNCDPVVPEGFITGDIQQTGSITADDAVLVGCVDANPCDAQLATNVAAVLIFSGPGLYSGDFLLTWVLP